MAGTYLLAYIVNTTAADMAIGITSYGNGINPLRAKFFSRNINMHSQFLSFLHTATT